MMNKEQTVMAVSKDTELSSWTCFSFPVSINVWNEHTLFSSFNVHLI